jgi:hypothetical protein
MRTGAAIFLAFAFLCTPSVAAAATATSDGATIRVVSSPGEVLELHVGNVLGGRTPGPFEFDASIGTITAGAGCSPAAGGAISCAVSGTPTVSIDLGDGDDAVRVANDRPMRVEVSGGPGNDTISGDHVLPPFAVAMTMDGGPGNDTFFPGLGPDVMAGGEGDDDVSYTFATAPVSVSLNGQPDDGPAGEGDNVLDAENVDGSTTAPNTLVGSALGESLSGGLEADVIDGGGGDDAVFGREGDDTLTGGPGNDLVSGEAGNDTLNLRDGAVDGAINSAAACGDGDDLVQADRLLDKWDDDCERVDEAWIGSPRIFVSAIHVAVRRGRVRLPVECLAAAGARCTGRVRLKTKRCVRLGGRCRKIVIARGRIRLGSGARVTLRLRASRKAARVTRRRVRLCSVTTRLAGSPPAHDAVLVGRR